MVADLITADAASRCDTRGDDSGISSVNTSKAGDMNTKEINNVLYPYPGSDAVSNDPSDSEELRTTNYKHTGRTPQGKIKSKVS